MTRIKTRGNDFFTLSNFKTNLQFIVERKIASVLYLIVPQYFRRISLSVQICKMSWKHRRIKAVPPVYPPYIYNVTEEDSISL